MNRKVTRKSEIKTLISGLLDTALDSSEFWSYFKKEILQQKVKFPLMEDVGLALSPLIPFEELSSFLHKMVAPHYEGSFVIAGILLKQHLGKHMSNCFELTNKIMIINDKWYACDIMSERVKGTALLQDFERSIQLLKTDGKSENKWVRRSIGIAAHLATKRGLEKPYQPSLLRLLLSHQNELNRDVRSGIGWGMKTIMRYHPELVKEIDLPYLEENEKWLFNKVTTGLNMPK